MEDSLISEVVEVTDSALARSLKSRGMEVVSMDIAWTVL